MFRHQSACSNAAADTAEQTCCAPRKAIRQTVTRRETRHEQRLCCNHRRHRHACENARSDIQCETVDGYENKDARCHEHERRNELPRERSTPVPRAIDQCADTAAEARESECNAGCGGTALVRGMCGHTDLEQTKSDRI